MAVTVVTALLAVPGHGRTADAVPPSSRPSVPVVERPVEPRPLSLPAHPDAIHTGRQVRVPRRDKVLVVPAYWGSKPPAFTRADVRKRVGETSRWFASTSRGRYRMSAKVTAYVRIPRPDCGSVALDSIARTATRRLRGVRVGSFSRVMLVTPECRTSSVAYLPGRVSWIRDARPGADVMVHELGHNLGLRHANARLCRRGGYVVTNGGKCGIQEYGDLYDAMGISSGSSVGQFSVPRLVGLGWAGRTRTLKGSGTVNLAPAEKSGKGIQGVRVPIGRTLSYWLEYRTNADVASLGEGIEGHAGVQLRLAAGPRDVAVLDAFPGAPNPYLHFPDGDLVRVDLPEGSAITTPEGIRFRTVSVGGNAVVQVTRKAAKPKPPAAPGAGVAYGADSRGYVSWGRVGDDGGDIVRGYRVRWPDGSTEDVKTVGGEITELTTYDWEAALGSVVSVQAYNEAGASPWSAPITVASPLPESQIVSPLAGAVVDGRFVQVVVQASPNALTGEPIESVQFGLNGYLGWSTPDTVPPYEAVLELHLPGANVINARVCAEWGCRDVSQTITASDPLPSLTLLSPTPGQTVGPQFPLVLRIRNNLSPLDGLTIWFGSESLYVPGPFTGDVTIPLDVSAMAAGPGTYSLSVDGYDDDSGDSFYTGQILVTYQP